jgi:hypothetical protein
MSGQEPTALRPRDLALLLLASRDLRPRKRARDQQADLAGLELKRRVLEGVAAIDPEPGEFEAALLRIAGDLGGPSGPARAVAALVRDEWDMACASPAWVAQLLAEAVQPSAAEGSRRA